jgi:hypothetical protein
MGEEKTETAPAALSSGEALAEILRLERANHELLKELVGFVNQAGEQIEQLASQGMGDLIGTFLGGNGQRGD